MNNRVMTVAGIAKCHTKGLYRKREREREPCLVCREECVKDQENLARTEYNFRTFHTSKNLSNLY